MRRAIVVLALLMLGGCVSDQGSLGNAAAVSAPAGSFADQARENNSDDPWKARSMCQNTSIGNDAKTVCY